MVSFTTDELVSRIKRKCLFPSVNAKLTDAQILDIADEEVQTRIYSSLMRIRSDYFVAHRYLTYAQGAQWVQLPSVLSSSTLVDVWYRQPGGSQPAWRLLVRSKSGAPWGAMQTEQATPNGYAIEGDRIGVFPRPAQDTTILLRYERRPSRMHLAASGRSAPIVSYDDTTFEFTVTPPTGFTTTAPVGTEMDIVRATPAFDALVQGMEVTTVASPVWTLASGTIDHTSPDTAPISQGDVNPGDYLTLQGETPVFPLPEVWWPICIYSAAATACREVGDMDQAAVNAAECDRLLNDATTLEAQRIRKQPLTIAPTTSPLRGGGAFALGISIDQIYVGRW